MKNTILFFLLLLLLASCSVTKVNVSEKYIKEISYFYDEPLPNYEDDYSAIWDYLLTNNQYFQEFNNDNTRLRQRTGKEFWNEVNSFAPLLKEQLATDERGEELATYIVGDKYEYQIESINIIGNYDNAGAYPHGLIIIGEGLINLTDVAGVMGVMAHEVAHVLFKHSERSRYSAKLRERKDNILTGITAGALIVAGGIAAANSDEEYSEEVTLAYANTIYDVTTAVNAELRYHSYKKYFEHSREFEIEADIAAVLFLKWLGLSADSYINLLSKLPSSGYIENNTHPEIPFRVAFLKNYIQNNSFRGIDIVNEKGGKRKNKKIIDDIYVW